MPRPKDNTPRVGEPYYDQSRDGWVVMERTAAGDRRCHRFATQKEALVFVETYRRETKAAALTLEGALTRYHEDQEARRLSKATIETTGHRLKFLTALYEAPLSSLTPKRVLAYYDAYQPPSDNTKHSAHRELKMLSAWLLKEKFVGVDLASLCTFEGKLNKGKEQLRRAESRLFVSTAISLYNEGEEMGLAVLLAFGLGLRRHEVMERLVRDVDDNATLLWVTKSKTPNGVRQIEIPPYLTELLLRQIDGKKPDERVFTKHCQNYLNIWTKRICEKAGVAKVTSQGLRGTFATLAISQGVAPLAVAGVIGHGDEGITIGGNYAKMGSVQSGGARHLATLLQKDTDNCIQPASKAQIESK